MLSNGDVDVKLDSNSTCKPIKSGNTELPQLERNWSYYPNLFILAISFAIAITHGVLGS